MSLAEADPDAHALLAEAMLAAHDEDGAAAEFGKALASRPDDDTFKRGLDRARRRPARGAVRHHRKAAPAAADGDEASDAEKEVLEAPAPQGVQKDERDEKPGKAEKSDSEPGASPPGEATSE